jgi:arsenate reductase
MQIIHNPRCSKSRQTLKILTDKGINPEVILYLKDPLTKERLGEIIKMLGINPHDLIRTTEQIYKSEYKGKELSDEQWIEAMVNNPTLIERPIVIEGDKAVLGRPPEKVLELIK